MVEIKHLMATDEIPIDLSQLAASQLADYDACTPGMLFANSPAILEADAYRIQSLVAEMRHQRGESLIGYKIGCTSKVIQQQLSINQPIFGRLFSSEDYESGIRLTTSRFDHPAIEGELAVQLKRDISDPFQSFDDFKSAIEAVFPVIELHNYVLRGSVPSAAELIANNGMHAGFVRPKHLQGDREPVDPSVLIKINGETVEHYGSGDLLEKVIQSLQWLAAILFKEQIRLKAGHIVLTGSQAGLYPVDPGMHVAVETSHFGTVEATFSP